MNNFTLRALSGTLYVALILFTVLSGPAFFNPLFALIVGVCTWEYLRVEIPNNKTALYFGIFGAVLIYLVVAFGLMGGNSLFRYVPVLMAIPFLVLINGLIFPKSNAFHDTASVLFSFFYIVLPFALLSSLQLWFKEGNGFSPILGVFILFWTNDTGAYLSGKTLGKHLLMPAVSPKKTVEGLVGGILLCMLAAYILSIFAPSLSLTNWLVIGALVGIFGTMGDLIESMWKRKHGLKDSGNIMPGHGGLMDRFDGFFIAVPAIHFYLFLLVF